MFRIRTIAVAGALVFGTSFATMGVTGALAAPSPTEHNQFAQEAAAGAEADHVDANELVDNVDVQEVDGANGDSTEAVNDGSADGPVAETTPTP